MSDIVGVQCCVNYKLFVCVNEQHESLCYFGHGAHFIVAIYCFISFLFSINVISVNTVKVSFVNSAKQYKYDASFCELEPDQQSLGKRFCNRS